ncbi:MAG: leucyl aminopeptidase [Actinobacteria bacterium]|nr:leucyl aminopeptidase [Actinomycetota bacterium]
MPQIITSEEDPLELSCDALVVGAFEGSDGPQLSTVGVALDERLGGALSEALLAEGFKAKRGTSSLIATLGRVPAGTIAVAGLGAKDAVDPSSVRRAAGAVAKRLSERTEVVAVLDEGYGDAGSAAQVEGYLLGSYRYEKISSRDDTPERTTRVLVHGSAASVERGIAYAEATNRARDLVNDPPDRLTPKAFAARAKNVADIGGLACKILDEVELANGGFGGILAVAAGSAEPPRLVELNYDPPGATGRVTIIGKGVTYDSGGLSIKSAAGMQNMKTDMGGGAAVIGAMSVLAKLGTLVAVRALIPMTENMIGPAAMRVDDVIVHYGGRTTEMNNADAEGRLILADTIALASEEPSDAMVDIATLTGHMVVGLGDKIGGLFANDSDLMDELKAAGDLAGEDLWPMPLYEGYEKHLDSQVADQKSAGKREGGGISAALFIQRFVGTGIPWAHLDIAGPGRADAPHDLGPKGGTGFGTRTLLEWIEARGR